MNPDPTTSTRESPHRDDRGWMGVLLPTCQEMTWHSSVRLDRPQVWWRLPGQWLHLTFCRLCRRYRRQLRWLHDSASATSTPASVPGNGPTLPSASKDRLRQALRDATSSRASVSPPAPESTSPPSHD